MIDSEVILTEAVELLDQFRRQGTPSNWEAHLPTDHARQRALALVFDRIGVEAFNEGDTVRAHDAFWHLFMLRLMIVKRQPDDRADVRDFATAEDLLALTLLEMNNLEPAEQLLSEALTYRRGLFEDDETDAHAAYLYGVALWHMAKLERAKKNESSEADWANQARDHLVRVDASWPGVSFIANELAEVERRIAEM